MVKNTCKYFIYDTSGIFIYDFRCVSICFCCYIHILLFNVFYSGPITQNKNYKLPLEQPDPRCDPVKGRRPVEVLQPNDLAMSCFETNLQIPAPAVKSSVKR